LRDKRAPRGRGAIATFRKLQALGLLPDMAAFQAVMQSQAATRHGDRIAAKTC
jgi:hypothetical protein